MADTTISATRATRTRLCEREREESAPGLMEDEVRERERIGCTSVIGRGERERDERERERILHQVIDDGGERERERERIATRVIGRGERERGKREGGREEERICHLPL
ncbi:hypothetical protein WMY93_011920 [Mugilogobius chulae]|uniref:Uncharacterized protein n=1 Tax=Mugilogobius chulae TaxID=88201 RepID=A0AAW0P7Q4_9GOBI